MTEQDKRPHVIICGSRGFGGSDAVFVRLNRLTANLKNPVVCTGAAVGADAFGELWAYSRRYLVLRFHPDLEKYKPPACYHMRNREMIEYCLKVRKAVCIAIWDGKSPGTKSVIDLCKKHGIQTRVIRYTK